MFIATNLNCTIQQNYTLKIENMPYVVLSENSDHDTILSNTEHKQNSVLSSVFFYIMFL